MEKIDDEWTSVGITTTLRVLFDNSKPECCRLGRVSTASLCGFGWRFAVDTEDKGKTIKLLFEPHLVENSALGPLDISVRRKSTEMKRMEYFDQLQLKNISVTSHHVSPTLATYESSDTFAYPILSITVSFPSTLPFQIPKPAGLLRMNGAIMHSLSGSEFFDTKFWCFSRRSRRATRVGDPRPTFGNSSILKDNSSYLETREWCF